MSHNTQAGKVPRAHWICRQRDVEQNSPWEPPPKEATPHSPARLTAGAGEDRDGDGDRIASHRIVSYRIAWIA